MKLNKLAVVLAATLACGSSHAVLITFTDPVGDQTGAVDVTNMNFDINTTNGNFTIVLTADAGHPFASTTSAFRININLFNSTRNEYFQSTFNDFRPLLEDSATQVTLTGTNTDLNDWLASDVIATSTFAGLGNPGGIAFFRSSVADLPFQSVCQSEDIIGLDGCPSGSTPAPATLALLGIGLASLGFIRRCAAQVTSTQ